MRHSRAAPGSGSAGSGMASKGAAAANSAVKWNVLPSPGWLSTQMQPPINCVNWEEMASPSPVPP